MPSVHQTQQTTQIKQPSVLMISVSLVMANAPSVFLRDIAKLALGGGL
jgi:hypothetical protein